MLRSALAALAALVVLGGGAFGVQAAILGKPTKAKLELTQTLHWLNDYTVSHAVVALHGRRVALACRDLWLGDLRISDVTVDGRSTILAVQGRIIGDTADKWATFQLAGCPLPLSKRMATDLVHGTVETSDAWRDGKPVFVIRSPAPHPEFELVVSQKTSLPLALSLLGRLKGESVVRYGTRR